jgi:oligosaccharide repeat unit polymerase
MLTTGMISGQALGIWPDLTIKHHTYCSWGTLLASWLFIVPYLIIYSQKVRKLTVRQNYFRTTGNRRLPMIKLMVVIVSVFSFISFVIYVRGYHGISNLLKLAPYLESPAFQQDIYEEYGRFHRYWLRFIPLIIYPVFFYNYFRKRSEVLFFIVIPIIVYMLFTFLTRERQATLMLLIVFLFGWQIRKNQYMSYPFILAVTGIILLFPLITFINKTFTYNYSAYLQLKETINPGNLLQQFNFEQIALYLSQHAEYKKFIHDDFINSLFGNFLPTSLRYKEPLNNLNSYLFLGVESHSVPPGIVAAGFYHLGYAGVVIWGFLLGMIVKITEIFFQSLIRHNNIFVFSYAYSFMVLFAYVRTGILGFSIYRPLNVALWIIIILSYRFIIRQKKDKHEDYPLN